MIHANRFIGLVVAVLVVGCATASTTSPAASTPPIASSTAPAVVEAPFATASPAVGPLATLVRSLPGGLCAITIISDEIEDGNNVMVEHFKCLITMTDPRLSGTLEMDLTTTFEPADAPTARWEGTLTITNAGGTWNGRGRGAVVMSAGVPTNYGAATYTGSGTYAGFTYQELIAGGDRDAATAGWIDERR